MSNKNTGLREWKRKPMISNPNLRWGLIIGGAVYLVIAFYTMDVNWARVAAGLPRAERYQPDH